MKQAQTPRFILLRGPWCERNDFFKYDIQNYKLVNDKTGSETDKTLIGADKSPWSGTRLSQCYHSLDHSETQYFRLHIINSAHSMVKADIPETSRDSSPEKVSHRKSHSLSFLLQFSICACAVVRGLEPGWADQQDQQQRQQLHSGQHQRVLARLQVNTRLIWGHREFVYAWFYYCHWARATAKCYSIKG